MKKPGIDRAFFVGHDIIGGLSGSLARRMGRMGRKPPSSLPSGHGREPCRTHQIWPSRRIIQMKKLSENRLRPLETRAVRVASSGPA